MGQFNKASVVLIAGIAIIATTMVMGKQYWNRKEIEKAIMLNAVMIERLPLLPFERGLALTASEKAGALDLADVENRVLLSAGLADEYQLAEFSQEYASYAIPTRSHRRTNSRSASGNGTQPRWPRSRLYRYGKSTRRGHRSMRSLRLS